jgi:hypothetical protein
MRGGQMETSTRCEAIKPDRSRCEVAALAESEFCFFHDPARAAERRTAQSMGGKGNRMKTLDPRIPDVKIESSEDVTALLSRTINDVLKGNIDPRVANAAAYLANIMMRAIEQNDHEKRLVRIETLLQNRMAFASGS